MKLRDIKKPFILDLFPLELKLEKPPVDIPDHISRFAVFEISFEDLVSVIRGHLNESHMNFLGLLLDFLVLVQIGNHIVLDFVEKFL